MKRYIGVAIGLGLLLVVLALTSAGPALAQGAIKPIMAFIVNDRANPVPVTVVAPPPQTTAICTGVLGAAGGVAEFVNIAVRYPQSSFVCSGDVTSIDVSRIVFAPDLPSFFANALRIA